MVAPCFLKMPSMGRKPRKKMGRPPKPTEDVKSEIVAFAVEPSRAGAYRAAAESKFNGVISDFARAACDALAAQLGHPAAPGEAPTPDRTQ
jgi:hypothetical protein